MIIDEDVYLEHVGVKGMKWGVRKDRTPGVSSKVDRTARKDAQEFARAKAFYGTGAGTRRKLIKQTVEGKAKRMPGYQKAFDNHLDRQDTSKHATKAVSERKRKDVGEKTKKTVNAVARRATGEMGTQAAFVAVVAVGVSYLKSPKGQQQARTAVRKIKNSSVVKNGGQFVQDVVNQWV